MPTLEELKNHQTVRTDAISDADAAVSVKGLSLWYDTFQALYNTSINFPKNQVTALIGASGCGKSTLLRCINRMNDLIPSVKIEGETTYHGINIYDKGVDPVEVRRRIGMVFQKPNPFPKTVWENVAFGPKINGYQGHCAAQPCGMK
jgi:phosphate transport system ATP-binding protein